MQTYIALLRGINVSGSKKIKMADLREKLQALELQNVQTYIQSGNIVFGFKTGEQDKLSAQIHQLILNKFGYEVPTLVKTLEEIQQVISENPFQYDSDKDPTRVFVTFLADEPATDKVENLKNYEQDPEELHHHGKTMYFYSPGNYGRAKLNNNFIESKLKVHATTRNMKTLNKLVEMAGG